MVIDAQREYRQQRQQQGGQAQQHGVPGKVGLAAPQAAPRRPEWTATATGEQRGNAFHWRYTLKQPVGDKVYDVQMDDWMYLVDDRVMLNRAEMSKFGVTLGAVTLSFTRR